MIFLIKAGQLILSLSILVILHELGHFLFARLFKTRVEKFYLFFNPWFSLFKVKKGETEYGIGWLPLGGYVKISGMIDESMDKEQMKQPPQPHEFRSKPSWQRLLIMTGGVLVNFLTAIIIFIFLLYHQGREYIRLTDLPYGVRWHEVAHNLGFQNGDQVLLVGDRQLEDVSAVTKQIVENNPHSITVMREGEQVEIALPPDFVQTLIMHDAIPVCMPLIPGIIDSVLPGTRAEEVGLLKGDNIFAINETPTPFFSDIRDVVGHNKQKAINLFVLRNSDTLTIQVQVPQAGLIGIAPVIPKISHEEYTLAQSVPAGINHGISTLGSYVKQLKHVFSKAGATKIGGFGTIGNLFPEKWDWATFWNLTAFLSIILAFMNILPIPALDGGHVAFLLFEMITGRKPGDKFLEYAQITGMILLLGLLLYANGNDLFRWLQQFLP